MAVSSLLQNKTSTIFVPTNFDFSGNSCNRMRNGQETTRSGRFSLPHQIFLVRAVCARCNFPITLAFPSGMFSALGKIVSTWISGKAFMFGNFWRRPVSALREAQQNPVAHQREQVVRDYRMFEVMACSLLKIIAERPERNRFIAGKSYW